MLLIIGIYMFIGVLVNGFELARGFLCHRGDFDEWSKDVGEWSQFDQFAVAIKMIFLWPVVLKLIMDELVCYLRKGSQ